MATVPPLVALAIQLSLWPFLRPNIWFLFFPAVFISSWYGGRLGAWWGSALSLTAVLVFFAPREHDLLLESVRVIFPSAVFFATGLAFGAFHHRLRVARAKAALALEAERSVKDDLTRAQAVSSTGSWRLDVGRGELRWSDETYRIFGQPPGTPMTYEAFLARVHPDDRAAVDAAWRRALEGQPYDVEHRILAGERVRWVRERADLDRDAQGKLIGGLGTVQDVTERKAAEAALELARDTERRLLGELEEVTRASTAIAEAVADLAKHDLAKVLHIIAVQAQALTSADYVAIGLGTDPKRTLDPWVAVGMDDDVAAAIGRLPHPVGTLAVVAREGTFLRLDDVRKHPAFGGFPAHHPHVAAFLGVPIRYHGEAVGNLFLGRKPGAAAFSSHDERMVHMLAARAGVAIETATLYHGEALQRAWLQTIIDQMPEAVVFLDEHGAVALENDAARALSRPPEEPGAGPRSLPFDVRLPTGARVPEADVPLLRAVTRGQSVIGEELALVNAAGELVPVIVSATPVRIGGKIAGAVAVFQDIRALKELERLREEWAALIAHDLRQPVNAITLSSSILMKLRGPSGSATERESLDRIRSASARLDRMIGDLLDSSRLEARRLSVEQKEVDLVRLIDEMLGSYRAAHPAFTFALRAEPVRPAWADEGRVRQVLDNLVSNAVKYGQKGTEVTVQVKGLGSWLEVAVTNFGRGVPPEELPMLFSRFGRTREARAGRAPGLGLGLYIAQGLVEAQGGRMWAESTPGQTTCFHFTVPRAEAAEASEPTLH